MNLKNLSDTQLLSMAKQHQDNLSNISDADLLKMAKIGGTKLPTSWLDKIANSGPISGINRVGSDIGTSIGEGVGNLRKLLGYNDPSARLMSQGVNTVAKAENLPQNNVDRALTSIAPYLATGALTGGASIPEEMIAQGLTGAFVNPNDRLQSGLEMAALPALLPGGVRTVKQGLKGIKTFAMAKKLVQRNADDTINYITRGKGLSGAVKRLGSNLKNNFNVRLAHNKNLYNTARTVAKDENTDILPNIDNLAKTFDLLEPSEIDSIPGKLVNRIKGYTTKNNRVNASGIRIDSPVSLDDAHKLQSDLGNEAASNDAYNSTPENKRTASILMDLRSSLKNDILKQLHTGKAGKLYQSASDDFRDNVVPYRRLLGKLSKGDEINFTPIAGKFKNADLGDISGIIPTVLRHGGNSLKDDIIATNLKGSGERGIVNAGKLFSAYKALEGKGVDTYLSPQAQSYLTNLEKALITAEKVKNISNKVKKPLKVAAYSGLAGLTGGGLFEIGKHL